MIEETSYGIVPLKRSEGGWQLLLIMHSKGGHWAFPKGHAEKGELPKQAAERELQEETGLRVRNYLSDASLTETYHFHRGKTVVQKTVVYFVAEVEGEIQLQAAEVFASRWVPWAEADHYISYKESKSISRQARELVEL